MQYQERMQNLLMRRDVLAVMNGESPSDKPKTEKDMKRHKEKNDFDRKMRAQRMSRQIGVRNEDRNAEKMVDKQLNTSLNSSQVIRADLRTQKERIETKLQERIRLRSAEAVLVRKRTSLDYGQSRQLSHECDRSGGGSNSSPEVDFESEFEKLMEQFVEKKLIMVQEIKARYVPQIEDLEGQKSEVVELVVENLKQQMNDEIAACVIKLEEGKNFQIKELKAKIPSLNH